MNAISAAVIGGVSMSGGKGGLFGTLIGALLIGVMQNGLDILMAFLLITRKSSRGLLFWWQYSSISGVTKKIKLYKRRILQ